jgi:hypothetical protein
MTGGYGTTPELRSVGRCGCVGRGANGSGACATVSHLARTSWRKAMSLKSAFPHAPASPAALASKGLGAASLLMVACETP